MRADIGLQRVPRRLFQPVTAQAASGARSLRLADRHAFRDGDGDIDGVLNYVLNLNFVVDSVRNLDIVNDSIVNFVVGCV